MWRLRHGELARGSPPPRLAVVLIGTNDLGMRVAGGREELLRAAAPTAQRCVSVGCPCNAHSPCFLCLLSLACFIAACFSRMLLGRRSSAGGVVQSDAAERGGASAAAGMALACLEGVGSSPSSRCAGWLPIVGQPCGAGAAFAFMESAILSSAGWEKCKAASFCCRLPPAQGVGVGLVGRKQWGWWPAECRESAVACCPCRVEAIAQLLLERLPSTQVGSSASACLMP